MNRNVLLLLTVAVLLVANIAYRVWQGWGLITLHAVDQPLSTVIRDLEKKGSITIRTNMDPSRKITMHVVRAPLAHALDVLANVSDSRLGLTYFFAPSKSEISSALATMTGGSRAEGWKRFEVDLPPGFSVDEEAVPGDGRHDIWQVKPEPEPKLQAYLEQGARHVSARFFTPETWNPAVASAPKAGPVESVVSRLTKSAGGQSMGVFFLRGRPANATAAAAGPERQGPEVGRRPPADASNRPATASDTSAEEEAAKRRQAMEERAQAEIAKIKDDAARAKALAEYQERQAFIQSVRDAAPDQRQRMIEDRITQSGGAGGPGGGAFGARRDALKTPDQRTERFRSYVSKKAAAAAPKN